MPADQQVPGLGSAGGGPLTIDPRRTRRGDSIRPCSYSAIRIASDEVAGHLIRARPPRRKRRARAPNLRRDHQTSRLPPGRREPEGLDGSCRPEAAAKSTDRLGRPNGRQDQHQRRAPGKAGRIVSGSIRASGRPVVVVTMNVLPFGANATDQSGRKVERPRAHEFS